MPVIKDKKLQVIEKINELVDSSLTKQKFISCDMVLFGGFYGYHYATIDNFRHAWVFLNTTANLIVLQTGTILEASVNRYSHYTPSTVNPPAAFKVKSDSEEEYNKISIAIIAWLFSKEL